MKYNAHLYALVRIKVTDIEADSQLEAIEKAEPIAGEFAHKHLSGDVRLFDQVENFEFVEEFAYALVDEQGDESYENSGFYESFVVANRIGWRTLRD